MPSYTTMTSGPRTRILRVRAAQDAHSVTSVTSPERARAIANALTDVGLAVPYMAQDILAVSGVPLPEPEEWEYEDARTINQWLSEPAPTEPVDVVRRTLALFDNPPSTGHYPYRLAALTTSLAEQPDAVRRAIRDELAALLAGYDDVPVIAYAADRKYNDCSWSLLITGALNQMDRREVEQLADSGSAAGALDILERRGDIEIPAEVTSVADQGHLRVAAHPAQLQAWLTRHHPDLTAAYASAVARSGVLD